MITTISVEKEDKKAFEELRLRYSAEANQLYNQIEFFSIVMKKLKKEGIK